MQLFSNSKEKSVVGLDIEAGSVAASEVATNGSVQVTRHGIAPLAPGIFREGEVADADELAAALKDIFADLQALARTVRLGVANQRVAVRTLFLPAIENGDELENAIRFQAQDHIPMPLDQAVLDWEVIGHTTSDNGERRVEVVVVAARRDMVSTLLDAVDKAGLSPVGHRSLGVRHDPGAAGRSAPGSGRRRSSPRRHPRGTSRAIAAPTSRPPSPRRRGWRSSTATSATSINLAVAQGSNCLFTRISPFGIEGVAQKLAQRRELTLEHARQWLIHVGLAKPLEEVDGDTQTVAATRQVLEEGAGKLADELRLSLEYYGAQEAAVAVEGIVACGPGTMIPGLIERLQGDLGHPFSVGRPAALASLDDATAARLTLSYGLALEE